MKQYKTTDYHFKVFKKEFLKWYHEFSLYHIEIYFRHQDDDNGGLAWCNFESNGMVATINLQKTWPGSKPNRAVIQKVAFHECMELFLYHARNISNSRFVTRAEGEEEWHRIIRTLESVVFGSVEGD